VTEHLEHLEDVQSFRLRSRAWLAANMPRMAPGGDGASGDATGGAAEVQWQRARELQRRLYDGGFAGICFPRQYGGLGLTPAHQRAFNEECAGYEMPLLFNIPTLSICAPTVLDMGTEEQKHRHLAAVIRGDEIMVQFLSEPRGGSDLAGVITRATRDGDMFVLSGAKIWSSGAYAADWALCLARTDWNAPKHRGLTMFLVKVHQPGVQVTRIRQVDGNDEFCQEFFDDVRVPASDVIGDVNAGWAVATRQLFHERMAVGGGSPYVSGPASHGNRGWSTAALVDTVRGAGLADDPRVRDLVAEAHAISRVQRQLVDRVAAGIRSEQLPPPAAAIGWLFAGQTTSRLAEIGVEILGPIAVTGDDGGTGDDGLRAGTAFLMRQAGSLGGGSTEMARNIISERVLGMPREHAADRDVPFGQVRQGR